MISSKGNRKQYGVAMDQLCLLKTNKPAKMLTHAFYIFMNNCSSSPVPL